MIGKITPPGKSLSSLLHYSMQKEKEAVFVAGNMAGRDPVELHAEFGEVFELNKRVQKPVFHSSISLPPNETLTLGEWNELANRFVAEMGYENSPWIAVEHHDRNHDHIHIIASRVGHDGRRVRDFQEKRRAETFLRKLEGEKQLRELQPSWKTKEATLTRAQAEQMIRTEHATPKIAARAAIELAAQNRPTLKQFVRELQRNGIEMRLNVQSTGRIAGASFRVGQTTLKASKVGRGYSWGKLLERIDYQPERDQPIVERLRLRKLAELQPEIDSLTRQAETIQKTQNEHRAAFDNAKIKVRDLESSMGRRLGFQLDPTQIDAAERRTQEKLATSLENLKYVYRNPTDARQVLRTAIRERGSDLRVVHELAKHPETLGKLRGGLLDRQQNHQATMHWAREISRDCQHGLETLAVIDQARSIAKRLAAVKHQDPNEAHQHDQRVQALARQLTLRAASFVPVPLQAAMSLQKAPASRLAKQFAKRVGSMLLHSTAGQLPVVGTLLQSGRLMKRLPRLARQLTRQRSRGLGR